MKVFRNDINSGTSVYLFASGKAASFFRGKYATDDPVEIAELDAEVAGKHPYIYVKEGEEEVETVDHLSALKEAAIKEYLEKQAAALDLTKTSESNQVFDTTSIANSSTVGAAMSGSTSTDAPVPTANTATIATPAVSGLAALKAKAS